MKKKQTILCALLTLTFISLAAACAEEETFLTLPPEEEVLTENVVIPSDDPSEEQILEGAEPLSPAPEPVPQTPVIEPEPIPAAPEPAMPVQAKYVYVKTDGLAVRTGAGTSYATLGSLQKGLLLALDGKQGNWYQTRYKSRTAYVSANTAYTSLTLLDEGEEDVENVIEEGLRLLGVPYVYGAVRLHDGNGKFLKGFTVKQFDCSSLMQYIFYEGAGTLLNVNTRTQIKQGTHVNKSDIKRGDLLFFTNDSRRYNTGIERVGHVALYLGDNYILHTASDFAKIEQISSKRWDYFIEARRILL